MSCDHFNFYRKEKKAKGSADNINVCANKALFNDSDNDKERKENEWNV